MNASLRRCLLICAGSLLTPASDAPASPAVYCTASNPSGHAWSNSCASPGIYVATSASASVDISGSANNWVIQVTVAGDEPDVTISQGNSGPQSIASISITVGNGLESDLTLADDNILTVGKITSSGSGRLFVMGKAAGNLGPPSSGAALSATAIGSRTLASAAPLWITGDVLGDIVLDDPTNDIGVQVAELLINGDLLGNLECHDGGLQFLLVDGKIGDASEEDEVTIDVKQDINYIRARRIHANIQAGAYGGPDSCIYSIVSRNLNSTLNGDFTGSITAYGIGDLMNMELLDGDAGEPVYNRIEIQGSLGREDLPGVITLESALTNYAGGPDTPTDDNVDERIVIGKSFVDGSSINLPEDGLQGQILTGTFGSGVWEAGAAVNVGESVTVSEPDYDTLPGDLGGSVAGSVGAAPYHLHGAACDPPDQSVMPIVTPGTAWHGEGDPTCEDLMSLAECPSTCLIRVKGPLFWDASPASNIVEVYRRALGTSSWGSAITSSFTSAIVNAGSEGLLRSAILVTKVSGGDLGVNWEYKIVPKSDLKCADMTGTPSAVFHPLAGTPPTDYGYHFTIWFDCRQTLINDFDVNHDGRLDYFDLLTWLENTQDLNYDGNVDAIDFYDLTYAVTYFNGL